MPTSIEGLSCTSCGYAFKGTTSVDNPDLVPDDGSVSICIECANLDLFTKDAFGRLGLRRATPDDLADLMKDRTIVDWMSGIILSRAIEGPEIGKS